MSRTSLATDGTETLVVAEPLLEKALGEGWTATGETFTGTDMERWTYERPFELVPFPSPAHFVVLGDYVTTEDGTGLVHQSPAFGAEDMAVCKAYDLPVVNPITADGHFEADVPMVGGQFFKTADRTLADDLAARGLMFRELGFEHSYPHCWRCHTPLMYYALPAWYIRTTAIKDQLLSENAGTNWFPETIKNGRYGDWLDNNIDWSLSRSRYWGTPLPIWRNDLDPSKLVCIGSLAELSELTGRDLADLDPHRPYIDDVTFEVDGVARHLPTGPRRHRRVVRLRLDAVRAVGLPARARLGGEVRAGLPRPVHLRGDRPDPRLVLLADGGRHARLRPELVRERRLPRPHPRRGRQEDEQAPRQHPAADAADGRARRRRAALVHGVLRIAVVAAAHRPYRAVGGRTQGAC